MLRQGTLEHSNWGAENLASFSAGDQPLESVDLATQFVNQWLNSPPHRENLLRHEYQSIGIGLACSQHDCIAVAQFGS